MLFNVIESATDAERKQLQGQQLKKVVRRVYEKTNFYRGRMTEMNLQPSDIQNAGDLEKLPFMNQSDLAANYPFGLLTMPLSGITRLRHGKSQEGLLFSAGFTNKDLGRKTEAIMRILVSCGITTGSVVMMDFSISSDNILPLRQAAESLGITVVNAIEDITLQIQAMIDFGVTTVFATPEKLFLLSAIAKSNGIDRLPLHNIICEHYQCHDDSRCMLENQFQIPVYLFYGRSDIMHLGIAGECHYQDGLHISDDFFIPEIIDPVTGGLLGEGEPGELALTTLFREGMPLIRYRTGDIAQLIRGRCICGRTTPRLKLIMDRKKEM